MNQPFRHLTCFSSSAALHAAAVGLVVWSAGQFVPEVEIDNGGSLGFVASISTTMPARTLHESPSIARAEITKDLVGHAADRLDVLNPVATQMLPANLAPTIVQAPEEATRLKTAPVPLGQFTFRPRAEDLLRPLDDADGLESGANKKRVSLAEQQSPASKQTRPNGQPDSRPTPQRAKVAPDKSREPKHDQAKVSEKKNSEPSSQPKQQDSSTAKRIASKSKAAKDTAEPRSQEPVTDPISKPAKLVADTKPSQKDAAAGSGAKSNQSQGNHVDELPRKLASNVAPQYPVEAYRNGHAGVVYLLVDIDANGSVSKATLHRSSGFMSLDAAARTAVLQWRFRPGVLDKNNVACRAVVPVRFRIE
jgi:periplasmic protein TonB